VKLVNDILYACVFLGLLWSFTPFLIHVRLLSVEPHILQDVFLILGVERLKKSREQKHKPTMHSLCMQPCSRWKQNPSGALATLQSVKHCNNESIVLLFTHDNLHHAIFSPSEPPEPRNRLVANHLR
jgi:hypothetical protein